MTNLPISVVPASPATEKLAITTMLISLKDNFGIDVNTDPKFDRNPTNSPKECCDYLVIGSEHAELTANQMKKRGLNVQTVILLNYRASTIHVGKIREELAKCTVSRDTIVVLQLFDNGLFMVATEEGGLIPMHKDPSGTIHAIGELVLVPKEWQWKLYDQIEKELTDLKENPTIIMAPLPRYMTGPCCESVDHMVNLRTTELRAAMEQEIYQVRKNLKDFAFRRGRRAVVTVSTWGLVKRLEEVWLDQIKLKEKGYFARGLWRLQRPCEVRGEGRRLAALP
jgi:hypothetical protein